MAFATEEDTVTKKDQDPETISVQMANGHTTSAGTHAPGDVVELPPAEAQALVDAGYAVRLGTVAAERMTQPDTRGKMYRPPRADS